MKHESPKSGFYIIFYRFILGLYSNPINKTIKLIKTVKIKKKIFSYTQRKTHVYTVATLL